MNRYGTMERIATAIIVVRATSHCIEGPMFLLYLFLDASMLPL